MGALVKGILQGSIPTIVLVGGTHYLVKGFKVSRPVVYWGSIAVAAGLTYAVVEGKIKAPFMNAETFNAETFEAKVGTPGTRVWVEPEGCYVDTYKHGIVVQEHPRHSKVYQNVKLLKTYRGDGHYISATTYARDLEWNYKPKTAVAETYNAEGGEPIYVVKRDYTGAETDYLIGTESYILKEMGVAIDVTAYELDIDYEDMSLEEIFDSVFEYGDEYDPELIGKFTDGMYLRLKSYDGDKDVGVLQMFDGETIDYTFDLSKLGFKHESNAETFEA
jgi:hypothetical protein